MRLLVAGVGSRYRGDDEAGLIVAARIAEELAEEADAVVLELEGEPLNLIEQMDSCEALMIIDAVVGGTPAGTVHRFDAGRQQLPPALRTDSTHALSVAEALELARALGRLPEHVLVFGIEGSAFSAGDPLSAAVAAAVPACVAAALSDARDLLRQPGGLP